MLEYGDIDERVFSEGLWGRSCRSSPQSDDPRLQRDPKKNRGNDPPLRRNKKRVRGNRSIPVLIVRHQRFADSRRACVSIVADNLDIDGNNIDDV